MTSRDSILAAIRGEPVERVPNMPLIKQFCTRQLGVRFVDYNRDPEVLVDAQLRICDRWPIDCLNVTGFAYREASDCGLQLVWPEDAPPHPVGVLINRREDIREIRWPDPRNGPLMSDRLRAIGLFKKRAPDLAVLGWVEGCWAQAATFVGLERALTDLIENPDLIREMMDFILPNEVEFARAQVECGADVIGVGDAAASLVGTDYYAEFILPYERELISSIKQMGVPVKLHICGDIAHLLPDVASTGADMVDIDWMVDLREARRVLGPEVCLCGNFDPVAVLLQSTAEHVRQSCRDCISASGPPYVLSPGCEVPPGTPPENFAALCEPYPSANSTDTRKDATP